MSASRLAAAAVPWVLVCFQGIAHAKGIEVVEERISISAPDEKGYAVVHAPSGSVLVGPNAIATFTIENSKSKQPLREVQGKVNADGSFTARIPASPEDKLKIRISSSDGGRKKLTRKVPRGSVVTARSFQPEKPLSHGIEKSPPIRITPELTIRYKGTSGPRERPLDADVEVLNSGVLPPD